MKKSEWNEALNSIDPELIDEYIIMKETLAKGKKSVSSLLRYGAIAACVVLVAGVIIAAPHFTKDSNTLTPSGDTVHGDTPNYEVTEPSEDSTGISESTSNIHNDSPNESEPLYPQDAEVITITAEDMSLAFSDFLALSGRTNQYTPVYVITEGDLDISQIPDTDYLPIYRKSVELLPTDVLQNFIDKYIDATSEYFNIRKNSYTIETITYENRLSLKTSKYHRAEMAWGDKYVTFSAYGNQLTLKHTNKRDGRVSSGIPISVYDSDEQIKTKLKDMIADICNKFEKDYSCIEIKRYCTEDEVEIIYVYLYSPTNASCLNDLSVVPAEEYITLSFYTEESSFTDSDWNCSADEAYLCEFTITENVITSTNGYLIEGISEMLNLEEAEALLAKGWVFGGNFCPMCMVNQELVDFTEYDYVGISYESNFKTGVYFPFYTFCKYIGENENGIKKYAQTYVTAIKLDGLDEYFENHADLHKYFSKATQ